MPTTDADNADDLAGGQIVIVIARWLLVLAGLGLTLWHPMESDLDRVRITILVLLALAVSNFYLHARSLIGRAVRAPLLYAASAADIAVITLIVWTKGGMSGAPFVFYFPALIAFALVFQGRITAAFDVCLVALYGVVALPGALTGAGLQVFALRLIALAAVAVVSSCFLQVERNRREDAGRRELASQG